MKVLLISLNFYPEDTAIGYYSTETALYLQSQGCEVTVIAGFPYYPQWKIWDDYRKKGLYDIENYKCIKILRFRQYVPQQPNLLKRIIHVLSFTFGNLFNVFRAGKQDIVIAVVPFLTSVVLAKIHNVLFGSKTWTHIQDFEIEAYNNSILNRNKPFMLKIFERIEKFLYSKSDRISTISRQMINSLIGKNERKPYFFPNFIDIKEYESPEDNYHSYFEQGALNILYSGNIGEKQDWDVLVALIRKLKDKEFIKFIIVGDGSKRAWLFEELKDIYNVSFYDPIPKKELPILLKSADLHLLFQKKTIVNSVMPSKILGMLASNKPILVLANKNSGLSEIIEQSNAGFCLSNYEVEKVLEIITTVNQLKKEGKKIQSDGLKYVSKNFSKQNVLNDFFIELSKTLNKVRD